MTIGLIYHGKDRDVVILGNTLKEAESIFQKNRKEIKEILKMPLDITAGTQNLRVSRQKKTTIDRLLELKKRHFFDNPKAISGIIKELKSIDLHFKPSDLTLPLRKLVRNGELKRTKNLPEGGKSKYWMWVALNIQTKEK